MSRIVVMTCMAPLLAAIRVSGMVDQTWAYGASASASPSHHMFCAFCLDRISFFSSHTIDFQHPSNSHQHICQVIRYGGPRKNSTGILVYLISAVWPGTEGGIHARQYGMTLEWTRIKTYTGMVSARSCHKVCIHWRACRVRNGRC